MILFSTSLYLCHSSWRFSLYCVSYLLTEWNDFTYYARNQNAPPCLTIFKNYSSFQKHKNIVRPQSHIAQVQADRLRYIYIYIYIYTLILFSITKHVCLVYRWFMELSNILVLYEFVLRAKVLIFLVWDFHARLYACLHKTLTYIPGINGSFGFQKLTNTYRCRPYDAVVKYNNGRVSFSSHEAVTISSCRLRRWHWKQSRSLFLGKIVGY